MYCRVERHVVVNMDLLESENRHLELIGAVQSHRHPHLESLVVLEIGR